MLKKTVSLLLVVSLLFALSACGFRGTRKNQIETNKNNASIETKSKDEEEKIIGRWRAEVDYTEAFNFVLQHSLVPYGDVKDIKAILIATFKKDGTYEMVTDEDSLVSVTGSFKRQVEKNLKEFFEKNPASAEIKIEKDGKILTIKEVAEEAINKIVIEREQLREIIRKNKLEGNYKMEGEQVFITRSKEDSFPSDDYKTLNIDGDRLTWDEKFEEEKENLILNSKIFPIVFVKE